MSESSDGVLPPRAFEPSVQFLGHNLAIAETYVRLNELGDTLFLKADLEPDCWRDYAGIGGVATTLKPDMYAVTFSDEYEDYWFIEVDLATEAPSQVITKCKRYIRYYQSGAEQRQSDVFPFVVWLVPDDKRKAVLQERMDSDLKDSPDIFRVVVAEEFEGLIRQGGNLTVK